MRDALRHNEGKAPVQYLSLDALAFQFEGYAAGAVLQALADVQFAAPEMPLQRALTRAARLLAGWYHSKLGQAAVERVQEHIPEAVPEFVNAVARVMEFGARKYAPWDWAKGQAWSIPLASATRHVLAVTAGEWNDPESQLPHLAHAGANVHMLQFFVRHGRGRNDLPVREKLPLFGSGEPAPALDDDLFLSPGLTD